MKHKKKGGPGLKPMQVQILIKASSGQTNLVKLTKIKCLDISRFLMM